MKIGGIFRNDVCVVPHVWSAVSAWERTRGLLGRPTLQQGQGMLIGECRLVHTIGMRYPLDLVFLDSRGRIKKLQRNVLPGRMAGCFSAHQTLELATGSLAGMALQTGDTLIWREVAA